MIEIDTDNIKENIRILKERARVRGFMAVVKADGYGHGAVEVSRAAVEGGATWLGVATVEEGIELTAEGINREILVLSEPPLHKSYVEELEYFDLTPVVYSVPFINMLPEGMEVHLKVDTGMHRIGIAPSEVAGFVSYIKQRKLKLTGLMTHFAAAERDPIGTVAQIDEFNKVVTAIGMNGVLVHASNTYGVLYQQAGYDMVRCGLGMYGLVGAEFGLKPALKWTSELKHTRWLAEGMRLSYDQVPFNGGYVGIVPVGYADGIPRRAGGKGWVAVEGKRYPVLSVTMDMMMVDLGRSVLERGAVVEIIGPNISANDWAQWLGVSVYEVVTGIGKRVKRTYV